MSGVEEISPEAWADACDSRGDLFTATIIRRLIAERDEARAEVERWKEEHLAGDTPFLRDRAERAEAAIARVEALCDEAGAQVFAGSARDRWLDYEDVSAAIEGQQ